MMRTLVVFCCLIAVAMADAGCRIGGKKIRVGQMVIYSINRSEGPICKKCTCQAKLLVLLCKSYDGPCRDRPWEATPPTTDAGCRIGGKKIRVGQMVIYSINRSEGPICKKCTCQAKLLVLLCKSYDGPCRDRPWEATPPTTDAGCLVGGNKISVGQMVFYRINRSPDPICRKCTCHAKPLGLVCKSYEGPCRDRPWKKSLPIPAEGCRVKGRILKFGKWFSYTITRPSGHICKLCNCHSPTYGLRCRYYGVHCKYRPWRVSTRDEAAGCRVKGKKIRVGQKVFYRINISPGPLCRRCTCYAKPRRLHCKNYGVPCNERPWNASTPDEDIQDTEDEDTKADCKYNGRTFNIGEDLFKHGCRRCTCIGKNIIKCSLANCEDKTLAAGCRVKGKKIRVGQKVFYRINISPGPLCRRCTCYAKPRGLHCKNYGVPCNERPWNASTPDEDTKPDCKYNGIEYKKGESFDQSCNKCICSDKDTITCSIETCDNKGSPVRRLSLCVTSNEEWLKCKTFTNIHCVLDSDALGCMKKINNYEADITTLDGGDIHMAGKCHYLKPIIAEISNGDAGYYAVAVAKINSTYTLNTLAGAKSCHTGVNKTAGWRVPMSVLFPSNNTNQLQRASEFFNASCAPGATPGSNLCQLCTPNCDRNSGDRYYGYDGAARCLEETDADIAFVKHTTFLSKDNRTEYKLLCIDGTYVPIDDYLSCYLAKVPSHAIVARAATSDIGIVNILRKLKKTPSYKLFSERFGKNIIFSSSTNELNATFKSYEEYLGPEYINAIPEIVC